MTYSELKSVKNLLDKVRELKEKIVILQCPFRMQCQEIVNEIKGMGGTDFLWRNAHGPQRGPLADIRLDQCFSAEDFAAKVRNGLDKVFLPRSKFESAQQHRAALAYNLFETRFKDLLKSDAKPDISAIKTLCRNMRDDSHEGLLNIIRMFPGAPQNHGQNGKYSFTPDLLPVAAQRAILAFLNGAVAAVPKQVAAGPAPSKVHLSTAHARKAQPPLAPASAADVTCPQQIDEDDERLFHQVSGSLRADRSSRDHLAETPPPAGVLEQNKHTLGFYEPPSPVRSLKGDEDAEDDDCAA